MSDAQFNLGWIYYEGEGVESNILKAIEWYEKAANQGNFDAANNIAYIYRNGVRVATNEAKAIEWYLESANRGDSDAAYNLGSFYEKLSNKKLFESIFIPTNKVFSKALFMAGNQYFNGEFGETNKYKSIFWYEKAAEQGLSDAQFQIGWAYYEGEGVETNIPEAIKWYKKAAEQGVSDAAYNIGLIYENGNGVATNEIKAFNWFLKSAENGDSDAQLKIGWYFQEGRGVTQDFEKAIEWYKKGNKNSSIESCYSLGVLFRKIQTTNSFNFLLNAATNDYIPAQAELGWSYLEGLDVTQNAEKAIYWFKKAAEQNDPRAQLGLALVYKFGKGVEKNLSKSLMYCFQAASNNNAHAQLELGWRYQSEIGVTQDFEKAIYWYELAIKNENINASYNLALLYENGFGVPEDNIQTFILCLNAAEQGYAIAQEKIAKMYYFGDGTFKNKEKAFEWYKKAAQNGVITAQRSLGYLYDNGIGVQTNYIEAFKWYYTAATQNQYNAQFNLGVLYQYGRGTPKNITNAFKFFLESADKGYNSAKQKIGWSENTNNLIELNILTNLYYLFAEQGNTAAQYGLGLIYNYGTILPKNKEKALNWYLKAAENGETDSFYRIARIYQTKKDKKAFEWFAKSSESGDYYADYKLGYIYFEGDNIPKDLNKALKHFQKVIQSPKANDELKGFSHLMTGLIQLKQGQTTEGFNNFKKSIKSSSIKKILVGLITIGVVGGVIFFIAVFLILYYVLKNNKFFSEKNSWSIIEAIAILSAFIFFQIGMSVMAFVPVFDKLFKDVFLKLLFWAFIGNSIVVFIAVMLAKIRPVSVWKQFGFYKINLKKWFLMVSSGWLSIIAVGIVYNLIMKFFGIEIESQLLAQEAQKYKDIGSIIFLILIVGFIMPIVEELIFRGVLYQALRSKLSVLFSILISSSIFAVVHVDIKFFVPLLATGIVCSYAFEKTKSIYTPIGIHVLNNLFTVSIMIFVSS